MGTVTGVHHRKNGVPGVQYPNDTTLYEVERHLLFGSAEEANTHLLVVHKKTSKPPPDKAPTDPEPKANPPLTPKRTRRPPLKKPTLLLTPHRHYGTPRRGHKRSKKQTQHPKWVYKKYESTHEYVCCVFVHV